MATPDQVKQQIRQEYERLKNHPNVFNLIKSLAMTGARHNGLLEHWREYLPDELLEKR